MTLLVVEPPLALLRLPWAVRWLGRTDGKPSETLASQNCHRWRQRLERYHRTSDLHAYLSMPMERCLRVVEPHRQALVAQRASADSLLMAQLL